MFPFSLHPFVYLVCPVVSKSSSVGPTVYRAEGCTLDYEQRNGDVR